jgi:hypothetical protein
MSKNKYKKWTMKNGDKIKVKKMKTSHIINCVKLLKRNGFESYSIFSFYMSCKGPSGDMAQLAFEKELNYWIDKKPTKWIDVFNKELKKRGVEEI